MSDAGDYFVIAGRQRPELWLVSDLFRSKQCAEETMRQLGLYGTVRRISVSYEWADEVDDESN